MSSTVPRRSGSGEHAEAGSQTAASTREDVLVQYVILRKDLWAVQKWPLGSVIAQGCHASTAALWSSRHDEFTSQYCAPDNLDHMRKVCSVLGCGIIALFEAAS